MLYIFIYQILSFQIFLNEGFLLCNYKQNVNVINQSIAYDIDSLVVLSSSINECDTAIVKAKIDLEQKAYNYYVSNLAGKFAKEFRQHLIDSFKLDVKVLTSVNPTFDSCYNNIVSKEFNNIHNVDLNELFDGFIVNQFLIRPAKGCFKLGSKTLHNEGILLLDSLADFILSRNIALEICIYLDTRERFISGNRLDELRANEINNYFNSKSRISPSQINVKACAFEKFTVHPDDIKKLNSLAEQEESHELNNRIEFRFKRK